MYQKHKQESRSKFCMLSPSCVKVQQMVMCVKKTRRQTREREEKMSHRPETVETGRDRQNQCERQRHITGEAEGETGGETDDQGERRRETE